MYCFYLARSQKCGRDVHCVTIWWNWVCVVWRVGDDVYILLIHDMCTVSILYDIYLCLVMFPDSGDVPWLSKSHHQDYDIFWQGIPINLHLPLCYREWFPIPNDIHIFCNQNTSIQDLLVKDLTLSLNPNSTWNIFYSSKSLFAGHDIFFAELDVTRTRMYRCHKSMPCCYAHTVSKTNVTSLTNQNPNKKKTTSPNEVQPNPIRLQMYTVQFNGWKRFTLVNHILVESKPSLYIF